VDRFLSVLTNGEHDNFIMKKREKQPKEEEGDTKMSETVSASNRKRFLDDLCSKF
jgi:hypothetical protein